MHARSLLTGRITGSTSGMDRAVLRMEGRTIQTDEEGTYRIPLDDCPLPLRLTISCPGHFSRTETIDWSPILGGGLLVRDFELIPTDRIRDPSSPFDNAEETLVLEAAPAPEDEEVFEDELDISAFDGILPAPDEVPAPGNETGRDQAPHTRPSENGRPDTIHRLTEIQARGEFIPVDRVRATETELAPQLDELLTRLDPDENPEGNARSEALHSNHEFDIPTIELDDLLNDDIPLGFDPNPPADEPEFDLIEEIEIEESFIDTESDAIDDEGLVVPHSPPPDPGFERDQTQGEEWDISVTLFGTAVENVRNEREAERLPPSSPPLSSLRGHESQRDSSPSLLRDALPPAGLPTPDGLPRIHVERAFKPTRS